MPKCLFRLHRFLLCNMRSRFALPALLSYIGSSKSERPPWLVHWAFVAETHGREMAVFGGR